MSGTTIGLRRKIQSAGDLHSVVRTMKALAASSIGQYEESVRALADYNRTVELGLGACFRQSGVSAPLPERKSATSPITAIVFGSDQGLVGPFNDIIADFAIKTLSELPGKPQIWAIGERVHARLQDADLKILGLFPVPNSVNAIAPLIAQILIESESESQNATNFDTATTAETPVHVFHHQPKSGAIYEPVAHRLLPLDTAWQQKLAKIPWPTKLPPEILPSSLSILPALIREYLFISLYRACAESLASENASRLAAMQRAERNIDELLETLRADYNHLRQSTIDEELFDLISGYENLD